MIHFDHVSFAYPSRPPLLCDISLTLNVREVAALIGPNGSGKSSLALLLNGLLKPTAGRISVDGMGTSNPAYQSEIRRRVGILFQNPEHQIVADTVTEEIAFGLELFNAPRNEMRQRVSELMQAFELQPLANRCPEELSGGQKQRLTIAATIAAGASYLVLDEPTALLDAKGRDTLFQVTSRLRQNKGILFITPFPEETSFADRLLYLDGGTLREISQDERNSFCMALENVG
jgi:energy-coupling factor transporter ATP-binding protein EcfA2